MPQHDMHKGLLHPFILNDPFGENLACNFAELSIWGTSCGKITTTACIILKVYHAEIHSASLRKPSCALTLSEACTHLQTRGTSPPAFRPSLRHGTASMQALDLEPSTHTAAHAVVQTSPMLLGVTSTSIMPETVLNLRCDASVMTICRCA